MHAKLHEQARQDSRAPRERLSFRSPSRASCIRIPYSSIDLSHTQGAVSLCICSVEGLARHIRKFDSLSSAGRISVALCSDAPLREIIAKICCIVLPVEAPADIAKLAALCASGSVLNLQQRTFINAPLHQFFDPASETPSLRTRAVFLPFPSDSKPRAPHPALHANRCADVHQEQEGGVCSRELESPRGSSHAERPGVRGDLGAALRCASPPQLDSAHPHADSEEMPRGLRYLRGVHPAALRAPLRLTRASSWNTRDRCRRRARPPAAALQRREAPR
ncbi:hypothetical protein DFH09DRAFT_1375912 [Mycena vulgaris]|nr:hypothetical protein DFH09DRAFT_1375912 [Mycena vulgaris]